MPRKDFVADKKDFAYAKAILSEIRNKTISTPKELELKRFYWCKKFKMKKMPTHPFILAQAKKPSKKMFELLSIKPTRSISGVQVIAVMMPPFPCPGECTYCPSSFEGKRAPKSYTGFEPSTLRAQRLNYEAKRIVENRINQLDLTGNNAEKIELIFQGSSFTALKKNLQEKIVKDSIDAITQKDSSSFIESKKNAETSVRRIVGITFETRPDYCSKSDVKQMLFLGGTRVELGVQNPDNKIYSKIKRGHLVSDVIDSTQLLKDSAFKVLYHLMPGLPFSNYKKDLKNFKKVFSDSDFKPDMVKFYPCLVIKGSELYNDWASGNFEPMEEEKAVKLLANIKSDLPKWVRVMRVNRDIPSNIISAGVKKTNLRQLVTKELELHGKKCNCIRCREIGVSRIRDGKNFSESQTKLLTEYYNASGGEEAFISVESKKHLYGFLRLRKPAKPFMKQINSRTALVRELHVYGKALSLGKKDVSAPQHTGMGKELMLEAERIAKQKFDANKLVVISGIGVREYYRKNFGFENDGPYVSKQI